MVYVVDYQKLSEALPVDKVNQDVLSRTLGVHPLVSICLLGNSFVVTKTVRSEF